MLLPKYYVVQISLTNINFLQFMDDNIKHVKCFRIFVHEMVVSAQQGSVLPDFNIVIRKFTKSTD